MSTFYKTCKMVFSEHILDVSQQSGGTKVQVDLLNGLSKSITENPSSVLPLSCPHVLMFPGSTKVLEIAKLRLILLNKCVPRLSDF